MTRAVHLVSVLVLAVVVVAGASATESTIYPGVGIGTIKLGMTQAQVERVLGKDFLVNERGTVGGAAYRELAWNFASWSVGFLRSGSTWRVVQVQTTVRPQRTVAGIGVSSTFKQVVKNYRALSCGGIYSTYGPDYEHSADNALILVSKGPVYTAFLIQPVERTNPNGTWRVYAVMVQQSVPGHLSLGRVPGRKDVIYHCKDGWRERGTPYTFP